MTSCAVETTSTIMVDETAHPAVAQDYGGYIQNIPAGVLRASTVEDVVAGVLYARRHGLELAVRGAGHSTHGQAQAAGGLALDLRGLKLDRAACAQSRASHL